MLTPRNESYDQSNSILKSRDITLPTNVHLVKAMVFLVVMYECESWTIKKDECSIIGAFELWCLRRLLRVPWTSRRSNQSILKEISPEYSLEGLMLKQAPILWPSDAKNWLIGKDPYVGKDWGQEEKGTTEDEMVGCDTFSELPNLAVTERPCLWGQGLYRSTPLLKNLRPTGDDPMS